MKSLKGLVICFTTEGFTKEFLEKARGWVRNHGGTVSKEVTPDLTHLIASSRAWKQYTKMVQQARRAKIRIVRIEWLEDSLLYKSRGRVDETKYYFEQCKLPSFKPFRKRMPSSSSSSLRSDETSRARVTTASATRWKKKGGSIQAGKLRLTKTDNMLGLAFKRTCQSQSDRMKSAGYHIYTDTEQCMYVVNLERHDTFEDTMEKHTVQLFESNEEPHTYALFTHYIHSGLRNTVEGALVEPGSPWDMVWSTFRSFFKQRTGRKWMDVKKDPSGCRVNESWTNDELFRWIRPCCADSCGCQHPESRNFNKKEKSVDRSAVAALVQTMEPVEVVES